MSLWVGGLVSLEFVSECLGKVKLWYVQGMYNACIILVQS